MLLSRPVTRMSVPKQLFLPCQGKQGVYFFLDLRIFSSVYVQDEKAHSAKEYKRKKDLLSSILYPPLKYRWHADRFVKVEEKMFLFSLFIPVKFCYIT